MKAHVEYTFELSPQEVLDLQCCYGEEKLTSDLLHQLLIDLGKGGVEEQIHVGHTRRMTTLYLA